MTAPISKEGLKRARATGRKRAERERKAGGFSASQWGVAALLDFPQLGLGLSKALFGPLTDQRNIDTHPAIGVEQIFCLAAVAFVLAVAAGFF